MKQCTIVKETSLSGIGLHLGKVVNITFIPAEINHGIKFVRVDLEDHPTIPADISKVIICCTHNSKNTQQMHRESNS